MSEGQALSDIESSVISRAYISMKLWLLSVQRAVAGGSGPRTLIQGCQMIWNELWPPFECVVISLLQSNSAANSLVRYPETVLLLRLTYLYSC